MTAVADAPERTRTAVAPVVAEAPAHTPVRLQPVGPGAAATPAARATAAPVGVVPVDPAAPPRWVRPLPAPFVVRMANALTEGRLFVLLLTLLLGVGVLAAAWSFGLVASQREDQPVVVVDPTLTPSAVSSPTLTPVPSATASEPERRYVIRRGDTLREIARVVYGDEELWPVLLEANRVTITDPDNLPVGVSLIIPSR